MHQQSVYPLLQNPVLRFTQKAISTHDANLIKASWTLPSHMRQCAADLLIHMYKKSRKNRNSHVSSSANPPPELPCVQNGAPAFGSGGYGFESDIRISATRELRPAGGCWKREKDKCGKVTCTESDAGFVLDQE